MDCCRTRRIKACSFRSRLDSITAVVHTAIKGARYLNIRQKYRKR